MDAALVADNVQKAYGETTAVDGVSLSVDPGEVFGLIGPNGAGKTTLVRALTGTTRYEGSVAVLGAPPTEVDRQRIGLLPQSFAPPSRLTARELIGYYAGLYDHTRTVESVLEDVGLADDADTWYEKLSTGQRRRVCVGTALVNDPDVMFLDEPTTAIDPAGRRSLWALIEQLAEGGTTVFLTSHSMTEVERLADRVGLMRNGQLVAVGTPNSLIRDYGGDSKLIIRQSLTGTGAAEQVQAHPSPEPTDTGTDHATDEPEVIAETLSADTEFEVSAASEDLVFTGVGPEDIPTVVEALNDHGVTYESLTWTEPSLEDVYLRLTGEAFEGRQTPVAGAIDPEETAPVQPDGGGDAATPPRAERRAKSQEGPNDD